MGQFINKSLFQTKGKRKHSQIVSCSTKLQSSVLSVIWNILKSHALFQQTHFAKKKKKSLWISPKLNIIINAFTFWA